MDELVHNPIVTIIALTCCSGLTGVFMLVVFRIWGSIANSLGERVKQFVPLVPDELPTNFGALPGEDLAWMGLPPIVRPGSRVTGPLKP